jgi:phosphonate transport system permease protein
MMAQTGNPDAQRWLFPPLVSGRLILGLLVLSVVLLWSGKATQIDRAVALTGQAVVVTLTGQGESQVAKGFAQMGQSLWPLQLETRTPISGANTAEGNHWLPFSYIAERTQKTRSLDPDTGQMVEGSKVVRELVVPYGYGLVVMGKLIETLQIALWGTILSLFLSIPLGFLGARNLMGDGLVVALARGLVSFLRAIPELISALFLVVAYGFGPIAGVLALGLHGAGFLGKFFADDSENADPKPQEALRALGASSLKMARYAVLPQVMPQYTAYTLYILDRNIRMATVIGLVGAGGIGQELKGRFDMYAYGHVATILLTIFLMVLVIDNVSAKLRQKLL